MKLTCVTLVFVFFASLIFGQKNISALRIEDNIKLDGKLDEAIWQNAEVATGFITFNPKFGDDPTSGTEVKMLYDDKAVYVGAFMKVDSRDDIQRELSVRDDIGNTDWFGVVLDTYGNGTEGSEFIVAVTGVQFDAKVTSDNEDENWNEVWFSEVTTTDDGWYAEMKIPYSAIRFPKKDVQKWRINYMRRLAGTGEKCSFQPLDPQVDGFINQTAHVTGVSNIKSPIRLSLSPYLTGYMQTNSTGGDSPQRSTGYSYNGGLDLKYGINEAFTLDMTLIPDFGQVQSDDQVLNLSPFEVRFDENRAFFTEGLDLFQKGGLFYTRRVGGTPLGYWSAPFNKYDNEVVVENPSETQLYNASKISGRTNGGLGIGVFNAVAGSTTVRYQNMDTDEIREEMTSPLTNYNVIVLDQNLRNNSSISLINTSVWRKGDQFYNANVTGVEFDLRNNKQSYGISGGANVSQLIFDNKDNINGLSYELELSKLSGNFRFDFETEGISQNYNNNDLGFLQESNVREHSFGSYYSFNKGWKSFDRGNVWFNTNLTTTYDQNKFSSLHFNGGFWTQTKSQWQLNMWTNFRPDSKDFFEPRVQGRHLNRPGMYNMGWYIGTDNRKKLKFEFSVFGLKRLEAEAYYAEFSIGPRYRFNDKFTVFLDFAPSLSARSRGFATFDQGVPILGYRDQSTVNSLVGVNYTFNSKMALNLRMRHYWSKVEYESFHGLSEEGDFTETEYMGNHDIIFNIFNLDLNYTWRFAPGSDIIFNWKSNIFKNDYSNDAETINSSYLNGVSDLSNLPSVNSVSLRLVYFLNAANYL